MIRMHQKVKQGEFSSSRVTFSAILSSSLKLQFQAGTLSRWSGWLLTTIRLNLVKSQVDLG